MHILRTPDDRSVGLPNYTFEPPSLLTRRHLLLGTALVGVLAGCGTLRGVAGAEPPTRRPRPSRSPTPTRNGANS